jgi:hypothetical protein
MREFPPKQGISFLLGDEVSFIAFHPWHLHIQLVNGPFLVSEYEIRFTPMGEAPQIQKIPIRQQKTTIYDLIGKKVSDIDVQGFTLTLKFDGGDALEVASVPGPYECGHFNRDGNYLVF